MPAVVLRNRHKFSPRAGTIHAHALRVGAKMTPPGQAIATMSTGDVSFAHNQIAPRKTFLVITDSLNRAYKFVTNYHRHGNRLLRPRVPVVNVHVGPADRCFTYADEHVVTANFWNGNVFEPQTRLGSRLYHGLHHFLHNGKVCQSAKQERIFATERAFVTLTSYATNRDGDGSVRTRPMAPAL